MFDQSVFCDEMYDVMKRLGVWYTRERHELFDGKQPFVHWSPFGTPITDMSWLAFGFNIPTESFYSNPWDVYKPNRATEHNLRLRSMFDCRPVSHRAARTITLIDQFNILSTHPQHALFLVARACLKCVASGTFPVGPMIAHHWLIGGRFFLRADGYSLPDYMDERQNLQPAKDLMDAVEHMLHPLNMRVTGIHDVPSSCIDPRDQLSDNVATACAAWPPIRGYYYDDTFPKGIIPFWKSESMTTCHLYAALIDSFSDQELVRDPGTTGWSPGCMSFYVDAELKYFIIFVREADHEPGNPIVTAWKIDFSMAGEQCQLYRTTKIQMYGVKRWSIRFFLTIYSTLRAPR